MHSNENNLMWILKAVACNALKNGKFLKDLPGSKIIPGLIHSIHAVSGLTLSSPVFE
jgi:hypothetical protein